MFRITHYMYQSIKSSVSIRDENLPLFACECGFRQGENLSPILFSLYLNDLEHFLLHNELQGITLDITDNEIMIYMRLFTLLYADDTVLMTDRPEEMQNCFNAFSSYCGVSSDLDGRRGALKREVFFSYFPLCSCLKL